MIDRISNQKARAFLQQLPPKPPRAFESKFPNADLTALDLLRRLLSFDPMDRPTASDALQHPYFSGLPNAAGLQDVPFMSREFDFELHKLTEAEVRALIYAEVSLLPRTQRSKPGQCGCAVSGLFIELRGTQLAVQQRLPNASCRRPA